MNYETIVIGAGLSGMMAALGRAERGERVMVLAKGHGSTHWAAGCLDLLAEAEDPLGAINQLVQAKPAHPYALAGVAALEQALTRVRGVGEAAGYPLVGNAGRNLLMPTALGALRPTAFVPATMVNGEARQLGDGRPTLIVGLHELRDFFPPLIAANLRAQGYPAEGVYLELPPVERSHDFSPVVVARLFERPAFRAAIGRQLAVLVRKGGYARVGLPAVLGLYNAVEVVRELQALTGALIFEIPTLPTSVPGMRLFQAFEQALTKAGGRIQIGGWVLRGEGSGSHLHAVFSEAASREQRHMARRWVLATGGIMGGGLRAEHTGVVNETALGLPVRTPSGRSDWFQARFLDEAGHPVFRAGIAVDAQLRPLDAADQIVYTNVAVVGSALADCDPIREGCLEGIALATGFAAGQL
ncbi:glycerol-3-phosphate dehydrogenase subunit GlpB [Candidatus Chloroploca asiatica]|uniref:Anaerobic glycerol-3-phosphate dehydrogenase subunit B n=1 Tax=Candidatus Chloroploca asiatica TaxID=1506545 RepID=A0A2H3LCV8_9CHLR|nr:glycerol-3-phosphate dehydrogenase subunit GlpB [Candidatus Chloroploca asiatica]PDW00340.1 anaerobic glycerol-3-phosphate dehydrogenase subunit B [Candidatus Chloroploca asiatica]